MENINTETQENCRPVRLTPDYFSEVISNLSDEQREWIIETGLGSVLKFNTKTYPTELSYFILDIYNPYLSAMQLENFRVEIEENDVKEILGLPMGSNDFVFSNDTARRDKWKMQFTFENHRELFLPSTICNAINNTDVVDENFKINFLVVLWNTLIQGSCKAYVDQTFVQFTGILDNCSDFNWCRTLLKYLNASWLSWNECRDKSFFTGSMPFLLFLFLERFATKENNPAAISPAFSYWTDSEIMKLKIDDFRHLGLECTSNDSRFDGIIAQEEGDEIDTIIKDVCIAINKTYVNDPEATPDIAVSYLDEAIREYMEIQQKCIEDLSYAKNNFPSNSLVNLLRLKFIKVNDNAMAFCSKHIIQPTINSKKLITYVDSRSNQFDKEHSEIMNLVNTTMGNEMDVIFKWKEVFGYRSDFKSMNFGDMILTSVIDIWSCILNITGSYGDTETPIRFFCFTFNTVGIINASKQIAYETLYTAFEENLNYTLKLFNVSFDKIDLLFFPMFFINHHYIVCYDLKNHILEILDNKHSDKLVNELYGDSLEILHSHLTRYVEGKGFQSINVFRKLVPKRLVMSWQTKYNDVDCGVFSMHHMDTYMGPTKKTWSSILVDESVEQLHQLNKLRMEFVNRMLMSNFNENIDMFLEDVLDTDN